MTEEDKKTIRKIIRDELYGVLNSVLLGMIGTILIIMVVVRITS